MTKEFTPVATTLLGAVNTRNIGLATHLLNQGADPNERNLMGDTCLLLAIREKLPQLVALLLERGADIDMKGHSSATPLMYAVREDCDILQFLLDKGASLEIKDSDGETAMDWAQYPGREKAAQIIRDAKAMKERMVASHKSASATQDVLRSQRGPVTVRMRPQP